MLVRALLPDRLASVAFRSDALASSSSPHLSAARSPDARQVLSRGDLLAQAPPAAERRLRLAQARAEESIVRAHVDNALMFMDTLAEDLSFDRAIDTYIRVMAIPEPLASTVATRALVVLGQDLVPFRRRQRGNGSAGGSSAVGANGEGEPMEDAGKPKLRLDEAAEARRRRRA